MSHARLLSLILSVWLVALGGGACRSESGRDPERQVAGTLHYEMRVPPDAGKETPLGLVVAIHGLAGDEHFFQKMFSKSEIPARLVFPRAPERWHRRGYSWFDIALLKDDLRIDAGDVRRSARLLAGLIERIRKKYPCRGETVVVGFSQGGVLAYALAVHHPEVLDLAVPISGYLPASLLPATGQKDEYPPVRAVHGGKDGTIPIQWARKTIRALRILGVDAQLLEHPQAGHRLTSGMQREILGILQKKSSRAPQEP